MIRSSVALAAMLAQGRSVARLAELAGETKWRWVMADTNEPVHGSALKRVVWSGSARVLATDLCGDPLQIGGA